jgi:hypothetical protein
MNWRVIYEYHGAEARSFRMKFRLALAMLRVNPAGIALQHVPTGFRISRRFLTRAPFRRGAL